MKTVTKEEIIVKAEQISEMLSQIEEVDFYKRAEQQVNENSTIQQLIDEIKHQQKEAVNLQHYGKTEALKLVEEKIKQLNEELDEIPLVKEFKQAQREVNKVLQQLTTNISNRVADQI